MTVPGTVAYITSAAEWQAALSTGSYMAASLQTQGFFHCSAFSAEQLLAVAEVWPWPTLYTPGRPDWCCC